MAALTVLITKTDASTDSLNVPGGMTAQAYTDAIVAAGGYWVGLVFTTLAQIKSITASA